MIRVLAWSLAAWNALAFGLCLYDKVQAKRNGRRVPERRLLGIAALGGSVGIWLGVALARHKVRKGGFLSWLLFWTALQLLGVLAWRFGPTIPY